MMIFQHTWKAVLDGTKTQTRRLIKPGEYACNQYGLWILDLNEHNLKYADLWDLDNPYRQSDYGPAVTLNNRRKWQVGCTYAVQSGRGQKAVGRIRITGIRDERLQEISVTDAMSEGLTHMAFPPFWEVPGPDLMGNTAIHAYSILWDTIHTKHGERWQDNPTVWVLEFELVKGGE